MSATRHHGRRDHVLDWCPQPDVTDAETTCLTGVLRTAFLAFVEKMPEIQSSGKDVVNAAPAAATPSGVAAKELGQEKNFVLSQIEKQLGQLEK